MRIRLNCFIKRPCDKVFEQLDRELFIYLLPPFSSLLRFDGSRTGDEVHLKLGPFLWVSEIVEHGSDGRQIFFTDEGRVLPFPLKKWHHRHIVECLDGGSRVVDDIYYSCGNAVIDLLMYPLLYMAFFPRVIQYKLWFKKQK